MVLTWDIIKNKEYFYMEVFKCAINITYQEEVFLAGTSATAIGLTFLPFSLRAKDQDQLNFYNWDDYIGEDTLSDFASAVGENKH